MVYGVLSVSSIQLGSNSIMEQDGSVSIHQPGGNIKQLVMLNNSETSGSIKWNSSTKQVEVVQQSSDGQTISQEVSNTDTNPVSSQAVHEYLYGDFKSSNFVSSGTQSELDLKAPLANPTFTGTVSGISKDMVGLGLVDNTSDANKPISTDTQSELDLKAPLANPTFTGTVSVTDKLAVNSTSSYPLVVDLAGSEQTTYDRVASFKNRDGTGVASTYFAVGGGVGFVLRSWGSNIQIRGNPNVNLYAGGAITGNKAYSVSSDNRIKFNEQNISNSTNTLMKLKPQMYTKVMVDEENETTETEEAGLIAQDIWYDAPELRHIVNIGSDADRSKLESGIKPEKEEDYEQMGWGKEYASVSYSQLIPYLIQSIQEQSERIKELEAKIMVQN